MTHEELFSVAYRNYPRGIPTDSPYYQKTTEYRRLVEARKRAGTGDEYERWRVGLERLSARLKLEVENESFHLAAGSHDACYSAKVTLPTLDPAIGVHALGVLVSFLVPYYVIYSSRHFNLRHHPRGHTITDPDVGLEFDATEAPYVRGIVEWIEASYPNCESMPKEVGTLIVPEIDTGMRPFGEATVYDALFSAHWQARESCIKCTESGPGMRAEAGYMKKAVLIFAAGGDDEEGADDVALMRMGAELFTGARYLQMLIWAGVLARHREVLDERLAQMANGMKAFLRTEGAFVGPNEMTEADVGEVDRLRELVRNGRWTEAEALARKLYKALGGEDTEVPAESWPEVLRERLSGRESL